MVIARETKGELLLNLGVSKGRGKEKSSNLDAECAHGSLEGTLVLGKPIKI